jgi:hypothetical protein
MMAAHSIFAAILPFLASVVILYRNREDLNENWIVFGLAIALSFVQGRPEIQQLYATVGATHEGLFAHGAPFFIILYLIFGRFELPSVTLAWAGSYFCLMVTDLSFNYFQWRIGPYDLPLLLSGIGGAGWADGLVITPLGAAAITAFARSKLQQGHTFRSMLGRQRYLITASEQSARLARP